MFVSVFEGCPDEFEIEGPDPDYSISIPLTASEDGFRTVNLDVRLIPKCWCGVNVCEFKFLYLLFDTGTDEPEEIYDRDKAKAYVDPVRNEIMDCVVRAATALIGVVQPQVIYRATFATHPPDKALHKHQMITDIFVSLGYGEPTVGMDGYHRVTWVMIKDGVENG